VTIGYGDEQGVVEEVSKKRKEDRKNEPAELALLRFRVPVCRFRCRRSQLATIDKHHRWRVANQCLLQR